MGKAGQMQRESLPCPISLKTRSADLVELLIPIWQLHKLSWKTSTIASTTAEIYRDTLQAVEMVLKLITATRTLDTSVSVF